MAEKLSSRHYSQIATNSPLIVAKKYHITIYENKKEDNYPPIMVYYISLEFKNKEGASLFDKIIDRIP